MKGQSFNAKIKANIQSLTDIADKAKGKFESKDDLHAALVAIRAYNGATAASRAQLIYKKMTSTPKEIEFLKD